jgi:hypothetical protein
VAEAGPDDAVVLQGNRAFGDEGHETATALHVIVGCGKP